MTGSRVGLGTLAAGWLWALAVAPGCYAPQIDNGSIGCADGGICPRGFACGVNRRCWRPPAAGGEELTDGGDGVDRPANGDGNDAGSGGKGAGAAGGPGEGGGSGAGVAGVGGTSGTGAGAAGAGGTSGTGGGSGGGGSTGAAGRGVAGSMAGAGGASGGGGGFGGRGSGGSTAGGSGGGAGAGGAVGRGGGSMAGAGGGSMAGTGGGSMAGAGGGSAPDAAVDAPPDAAKKPLGAPCAAGAECGSQLCVDGVCCDGACMGSCEACDTAAATGHCAAVSSGAPHGARAACAGTGTCSGACAAASRTACTYPGSSVTCRPQGCTGNTLTPAAFCDGAGSCPGAASRPCDGDLVCNNGGTACLSACRADADCLAPTPYCQASTCTAARPDGVTCASDGQCQGGRCIDGVCCDRPCTDQCQACDVAGHAGTCWPIPSQEPPHGQRGACSGTGACAGFCDGSSTQCAYPGSETACPCAVLAGTCNGAGQCALLGSLCL